MSWLEKKCCQNSSKGKDNWIKVGMSTCGIAAGAQEVFDYFLDELKDKGMAVSVLRCGCAGKCYAEPLVEVKVSGLPAVTYGNVDKKVASEIVKRHIKEKKLLDGYIYGIRETSGEK